MLGIICCYKVNRLISESPCLISQIPVSVNIHFSIPLLIISKLLISSSLTFTDCINSLTPPPHPISLLHLLNTIHLGAFRLDCITKLYVKLIWSFLSLFLLFLFLSFFFIGFPLLPHHFSSC